MFGQVKIPPALRPLKCVKLDACTGAALYAVGDIHGCWDELQATVEAIRRHAAPSGVTPRVVFIGDFIDRGPQSLKVWEWLHRDEPGMEKILIDGNHEFMAEHALYGNNERDRRTACTNWLKNGGDKTVKPILARPDDLQKLDPAAVEAVRRKMPRSDFAKHCNIVSCGPYLITHAAIDPALPIEAQNPLTTMWSRGHRPVEGRILVHGHTVDPFGPEIRGTVINLDQGAYRCHRLTSVALWPDLRRERVTPETFHPPEV